MSAGRMLDELVGALRVGDRAARERAVETLRGLRSPEVLARLRPLAFDAEESEVDRAALLALVYMGDGRAAAACGIALAGQGPERERCAEALGFAVGAETEAALVAALGDRVPAVRVQAAESLARLGQPSWRLRVRGDEGDLRRLVDGDPSALIEPLLRALSQGSAEAAELLDGSGEARARVPLEVALASSDDALRAAAAMALSSCGDRRSKGPLAALFGDPVGAVRAAAAHAYALHGSARWAMWLHGDDGDWERLGESGDERARRPLLQAAERGEVDAIPALGVLRLEMSGGDFHALLFRGDHPAIQAVAAGVLASLGHGEGAQVLEGAGAVDALSYLTVDELLGDEAVAALGRLGGPKAHETGRVLLFGESRADVRALIDEREALFFAPARRRAIAEALAEARSTRSRGLTLLMMLADADGLLDALVDRDEGIRGQASAALSSLGQPEWGAVIRGDRGDLRRLAESELPERLRLLVVAREQGAELPAAARALLQEAQVGAFSLGGGAGVGDVSVAESRADGGISLGDGEE